jgi:DNA-binding protein H-NS
VDSSSSTTAARAQPARSDAVQPLSAREKAAIVHHLRSLVEYWSITPEELLGPSPRRRHTQPVCTTVKYRHPNSGETWDGNGPHPQWLRDALLKDGYTVDQLRPPPDDAT